MFGKTRPTLVTLAARRAARRAERLEHQNIEVGRLVAQKTAELALEKSTASRGLLAVQVNEADLYGYTDENEDALQAFLAGRRVRDSGDNRTNVYLLGLAHSAAGKDWPRKVNTRIVHEVGHLLGLTNTGVPMVVFVALLVRPLGAAGWPVWALGLKYSVVVAVVGPGDERKTHEAEISVVALGQEAGRARGRPGNPNEDHRLCRAEEGA